MNSIFDMLIGSRREQSSRRKATVIAIYITAITLVISLLVLLVSSVVFAIAGNRADDPDNAPTESGDASNTGAGYTVWNDMPQNQLYTGDLIITDAAHSRNSASGNTLKLIAEVENRSKTDAGTNTYTIFGTGALSGTAEAVSALNSMLGDYYVKSSGKTDDNIIISNAARPDGSNDDIYDSGLVFELKYYEIYNSAEDNKVSTVYGVPKYKWIYENAHKYGFIQMYPTSSDSESDENAAKANIFRYVGVAHASQIKNKNCTLESYLDSLKSKTYKQSLSFTASDGNKYVIYYVASGDPIYVSEKYEFEVSGNNIDGYIITENRSMPKKADS